VYAGFWWGNLSERDHLKGPGISECIILKWIFRKWNGSKEWIDLPWNMER